MIKLTPPHPELVTGPNPLLETAAPFLSFSKLPSALRNEPLSEFDWRATAPEYRVAHLSLAQQHYWPCRNVLDVADSIQSMLRGGLMARNPLSIVEQRRINALALADRLKGIQLHSLRVPAGGGIISAITGMGKSALLTRSLQVMAPEQVVVHSRSEACGWSSLTQVLYLVIDAPSNGTRGGLLARIAEGLDVLLGTDYSEALRKLRNLESSLLFVTKLLSIHRVGMLAIDENQLENFDESLWQRTFILFFLGLMNLGIPVLLLGNPLAFTGLESASQNMRRLSTAGHHKLVPAKEASDVWWAEHCVPGMCRFSLCEEMPPIPEIVAATFEVSAGVPGLFGAVWAEAQRIALRRGGERTVLTHDDITVAFDSPRVLEIRNIAAQIMGRVKARRFLDIPAETPEPYAGDAQAKNAKDEAGANAADRKTVDPIQAARSKLERQALAKERQAAKRREKADIPCAEDIRNYEQQMEMFAGLEGMQEALLSGAKRAAPKER